MNFDANNDGRADLGEIREKTEKMMEDMRAAKRKMQLERVRNLGEPTSSESQGRPERRPRPPTEAREPGQLRPLPRSPTKEEKRPTRARVPLSPRKDTRLEPEA